jgi:hypothetical protein
LLRHESLALPGASLEGRWSSVVPPLSILEDHSQPPVMRVIAGPLLAVIGLLVWAIFALLPALSLSTGQAFRPKEAWDNEAYWMLGVPILLVAQAAGAVVMSGGVSRLPLWLLGGQLSGS